MRTIQLPERKKNILKTIIENYILSAEPVGSKTVADELGNLSSATIRHEMSELEELGFLEKPHISAGRVPSPLAYRVYVDELMGGLPQESYAMELLQASLTEKISELGNVVANASKILSELTNYAGVSFSRRKSAPIFSKIQLIPIENCLSYALVAVTTSAEVKSQIISVERPISESEIDVFVNSVNRLLKERSSAAIFQAVSQMLSPIDAIYPLAVQVFGFICSDDGRQDDNFHIDGTARLLSQPEFQDKSKILQLLNFLSDANSVSEIAVPQTSNLVNIEIAPTTKSGRLDDTAFIFTTYDMGDDVQGVIGIIGPSRMDYAATTAKLELFAKAIGKYFPVSFEYKKDDTTEE